jgi:hypothetical protein
MKPDTSPDTFDKDLCDVTGVVSRRREDIQHDGCGLAEEMNDSITVVGPTNL